MIKRTATTAALLAMLAGSAVANSSPGTYFGSQEAFREGQHNLTINLVRTKQPATIQLEDVRGRVIATKDGDAGVYRNVKLSTTLASLNNDVIAKLIVNGEVADRIRIQTKR